MFKNLRKPEMNACYYFRFALIVLSLCFSIFFLVVYMDQNLPIPLTLHDVSKHPERFIEERARNALKKLTSVGPRPAGFWQLYTRFQISWAIETIFFSFSVFVNQEVMKMRSWQLTFCADKFHLYNKSQNLYTNLAWIFKNHEDLSTL